MKPRTLILKSLICFMIITSCSSDKLSHSKAEDIISDCLDINPEQRKAFLQLGKITFTDNAYDTALFEKYKTLEDDGMLNLEFIKEINRYGKRKEYNVTLTKKAGIYIENLPEQGSSGTFKSFKYVVDDILEIQEIPAENRAKVKVQFKAVDITPFAILSKKDPAEFWIKNIRMVKTSNGWKHCDNF